MSRYVDIFKSWADVQREFDMKEPEPDEVLLAYYSYQSYSGEAYVIYRKGEDYYVVNSGHCSCHGLEHGWEPELYESKHLLIECLKNEHLDYYNSDLKDLVQTIVQELENGQTAVNNQG